MDEVTLMEDSLGVEDTSGALDDEKVALDRVMSLDANELDDELNVSKLKVDVVDDASPGGEKDSLSVDVDSLKLKVVNENCSLDRVMSLEQLDEELDVSELSWVNWLDVVDKVSSVEDDDSLIVDEASLALEAVEKDDSPASDKSVSLGSTDDDVGYTEYSTGLELFQPFHQLSVADDDRSTAVGVNTSTVVRPPDEASGVMVAVKVPVHPVVTNVCPGINTSTVSRPSPEAGKIVVVEVTDPVQ